MNTYDFIPEIGMARAITVTLLDNILCVCKLQVVSEALAFRTTSSSGHAFLKAREKLNRNWTYVEKSALVYNLIVISYSCITRTIEFEVHFIRNTYTTQ